MRQIRFIIVLIAFTINGCGVFVRQPIYYPSKNLQGSQSKSYFKYWDGSINFIRSSIFDESNVILICIPGLGAYTSSYHFFQDYFSNNRISTVGVDLRGFGHWQGKKGDLKNIGLHIQDINQVIDYYKSLSPNTKIILVGESLGSSLSLWYSSLYPEKIDGLILTSIVTNKGENGVSFSTIIHLLMGYVFIPTKPIYLGYDPQLYSTDTIFLNWASKNDTLGTNSISPRYLIQANRLIQNSYKYLCNTAKPTLIIQGGKDFLSEQSQLIKIISNCKTGMISLDFYPNSHHSLINDFERQAIFTRISDWIQINFK